MNRRLLTVTAILAVIIMSCGKGKQPAGSAAVTSAVTVIDKGFSKFIAAYTTGVVTAGSTLQVVFTPDFAATIDRNRTQGLFSFTPAFKGTAEWADDVSLVYKPSKPLPSGTSFQGTLDMSRLGQVEERFRFFPLTFRTVEKNFTVTINPVTVDLPDGNSYTVTGTVVTSDQVDKAEVEKYLTDRVGRRDEKIRMDHDNRNCTPLPLRRSAGRRSRRSSPWHGTAHDNGIKTKGEQSSLYLPRESFPS